MNIRGTSLQLKWFRAAIAVVPIVAASLLGQWATYPNLAPWYAALSKPWFNPPRRADARWRPIAIWTEGRN